MAELPAEITVTVRAIDLATPVLKRIQRRLWWMQHGEGVMRAVTVLLVAAAFVLGRITA